MLDLVIFGLDGTLVAPRAHAAIPCFQDEPNDIVSAVYYDHFVASRDMWIVCDRSEAEREDTEDWLFMRGLYYTKLLMRTLGDTRIAADLALRHLHDGTIPKDRILCAYDSDAAVVSMYRAEGIQCFHVLDGDH